MGAAVDVLWKMAIDQHGYITTQNATSAGVPKTYLPQLASRAASPILHRVTHGVYRFSEDRIPVDEWDPYMLATLWPAGRGVLSHDTALQLHDLCDVNPNRIHVTVPRAYRVRRAGSEPYVIHRMDLDPGQLDGVEGIRIVTPIVAITQGIAAHVPLHLLRQAVESATKRGLVTPDAIADFHRQLDDVR